MKLKLITLFIFCFGLLPTVAQNNISGTVTDRSNQPLPGVNIVIEGTSTGTTTDFDGKFEINARQGQTLKFSYIGFKDQQLIVGSQEEINIIMLENTSILDEIVVVGYGTQKKSDLTGSISSVSSKDFEDVPMTRLDEALQGRAAGVQVTQTGGGPGGSFKIRIRGTNSIAGNNTPLYVLDGIIVANINSLNVNDIQSMEILKDASSTAIYGSRGANGVVLITTKTGKKGEAKIDFQSFYSTSSVVQELDLMTAAEFAEGVNFRDDSEIFTQAQIDELRINGGENWHDRLFRTASIYNADLSISGGSETIDYYISSNYLDSEGTKINQDLKRYTLRANINAKLSDRLKIGLNSFVSHQKATGLEANLSTGLSWDPTTPAFDENGDYNFVPLINDVGNGSTNPLVAPENTVVENFINRITLGSYLNYDISKNLVLNISGGLDRVDVNNNTYIPLIVNNLGVAVVANNSTTRLQNTNRLTYTLDKNPNHKLKLDAIHEQQTVLTNNRTSRVEGFFTDNTTYKDLALGAIQINSSAFTNENIQSFLGRANYSLFEKYLFTASIRTDGSSKFREGNRWGVFPSGSVAWIISNENFIKDSRTISNLKARFSYGVIGSQAISVFDTRSIPIINESINYPFTGETLDVGVAPSNRLANPDLTWETTKQANLGIDLGLWNSKMTLSLDLYKKNTEDLLLDRVLPAFVGPTVQTVNVGEVENKGFDITLGLNLVDSDDWNISSTLTLSSNKNEVLSLVDDDQPIELGSAFRGVNPTRVEVGLPISSFRGYIFEGVWQLGEETEAAVFGRAPGDAKYRDVNGDGAITTDDITTAGDPNADYTWGWNWDVSYKNFNVNFVLLGSKGNDIYNIQRSRLMGLGAAQFHAVHADYNNRWTPTNPSNIPATVDGTQILSTQFIEDGSFVTLKNVSLSYDFDAKVVRDIGLKGLNLFVNAENLFIMTDYTGFDPETTATGNSDIDTGIDLNTYPLNRTFTLGLKATF